MNDVIMTPTRIMIANVSKDPSHLGSCDAQFAAAAINGAGVCQTGRIERPQYGVGVDRAIRYRANRRHKVTFAKSILLI